MTRVPDSVLLILASDPVVARAMSVSRQRMLTTLLLSLPVSALDLISWYRRAIIEGRFSSDPTIVFKLFRSLDRKGKFDLATSFCGSSLDTRSFVKLVSLVYRTCPMTIRERDHLAETISRHAAVFHNISDPGYVSLVRRLLKSRRGWERAHGVSALESLAGIHPDLCLRLAQLVRDPLHYVRTNAWSGALALLHRGRLTAEAHRALLRNSLAALKDKDKHVRRNARLFRRYSRARPPVADGDLRSRSRRGAEHHSVAVGVI